MRQIQRDSDACAQLLSDHRKNALPSTARSRSGAIMLLSVTTPLYLLRDSSKRSMIIAASVAPAMTCVCQTNWLDEPVHIDAKIGRAGSLDVGLYSSLSQHVHVEHGVLCHAGFRSIQMRSMWRHWRSRSIRRMHPRIRRPQSSEDHLHPSELSGRSAPGPFC